MARKWLRERRKDYYYRMAKKEHYRSRASYKLMYIQEKYGIIKEGDVVVDLGCAPGGWLQVARELAGASGSVFGIDLEEIEPLDGVVFIRGNFLREETRERLRTAIVETTGRENVDVVLSDMSPNISGNYSIDHARSVDLVTHAFEFACQLLVHGGNFVAKVFQGDMYESLIRKFSAKFALVKGYKSDASRKSSSEIYIVCKGYCP
ncbi:MAG: RlmE family RNA methyltransferase [Thermoplasmata archaeon]|nr:RlmE family RNA methyltransferase [Thermoplasmata archaeon]